MVAQHYRWDFIGLSTDTKPTPETSEKVVNGSTFYCSDDSKLYVFCDGTWYERKPLGGGGATYTAGEGIDIEDNTISVDTDTIQSKLTAGDNITISDDTIAATDTTYTAGTNVSISEENVISATDTTYSAFTGTDGQTAGTAGLVPAPATTDADKYLKSDGTWGTFSGGGPTVVQSLGVSQTDVMSQNAVTSMIYADPANRRQIRIGDASTGDNNAIAIGKHANAQSQQTIAIGGANNGDTTASANSAIAIGSKSSATASGSIALGIGASATSSGQMDISTNNTVFGYNSSNYRLLTGLYDPQNAHDAATKGYVDPTTDSSAPTTATVGRLGQIQIDSANADAYMCVAVDTVTPSYTWKKITP